MTNEIKTRYLIVELPDTSGEEADIAIGDVLDGLREGKVGWNIDEQPTATHVLGETLPDEVFLTTDDGIRLNMNYKGDRLTPYEARQLAGALLNIPGVADAEPPTACKHCGQPGHHADEPPSPFQVVGEYVATVKNQEV